MALNRIQFPRIFYLISYLIFYQISVLPIVIFDPISDLIFCQIFYQTSVLLIAIFDLIFCPMFGLKFFVFLIFDLISVQMFVLLRFPLGLESSVFWASAVLNYFQTESHENPCQRERHSN